MNFKVQIENFEGPIDVLLQLIEKRKMPINDISLADITDDYIQFVQKLEDQSLSAKTHFIFVASTLTLMKSKSILPSLELTNEEESDIEALKKRLAIFKEYQDAAAVLKSHIHNKPQFYYAKTRKKEIEFTPHSIITADQLLVSLQTVFIEIPTEPQTKKEAYIKIAVHIDEMMASLETRIRKAVKMDFDSFIGEVSNKQTEPKQIKVYKVVGFLAMLELVRNGALDVIQKKNFSSIQIEKI